MNPCIFHAQEKHTVASYPVSTASFFSNIQRKKLAVRAAFFPTYKKKLAVESGYEASIHVYICEAFIVLCSST